MVGSTNIDTLREEFTEMNVVLTEGWSLWLGPQTLIH